MSKKIFLFLLLPIFLYSQNLETTPKETIKVIGKDVQNKKNINLSDLKKIESNTNKTKKEELSKEEQLVKEQNKLLEETIKNINNEGYLITEKNISSHKKELLLLQNKININKKSHNTLAVKRDQIKILLIQEKMSYEKTLRDIIIAKQEFKDKAYIKNLLLDNIKKLEESPLSSFEEKYQTQLNDKNPISTEFLENYAKLYNQNYTQTFVLRYLLENITRIKPTNFLIDEFNLEYVVKKIDSIKGISTISNISSYYLNFTIGEIILVIFILVFFRLISKYVIRFISSFISKIFIKETQENEEDVETLKKSIYRPFSYLLTVLGIHISILLLIKDEAFINKLIPWINTIYIAIFTWIIYAAINNIITIHAQSLLDKHPNVRKEMIVFILRIIKIILVIIVFLFLLTQLGIDIKAIAASLGVGGIAVALASKDTLANFFGSLNIMTDNSFSQGDWIKTNDIEGTVVDIRMRTTRIRTFDNAMITVPNSELANTHIMNWSKRKIGRRIKMSLGITYESKIGDIQNLKDDIYDMLKSHDEIASSFNINIKKSKAFEIATKEDLLGIKNTLLVYIDEFAPSSINILIYCFSKSPNWENWLKTKEDVLIKIAKLVEKNHCEFAYPTQAISIKPQDNLIENKKNEGFY